MKEIRDMDGVYFRVERDGKWKNICFSDLTKEEREPLLANKSPEWLRSLCNILADFLYEAGEFVERREEEP